MMQDDQASDLSKQKSDLESLLPLTESLTVLIVEDNISIRKMIAMLLSELFGRVIQAEDGEEGLALFQEESIDLVMSDINMPRMDGLQMAKAIRKIDGEVPILFISAHNDESFFLESIKIGVDGYMVKPLRMPELINTLKRVAQKIDYLKRARKYHRLIHTYQKAVDAASIVSKADAQGIITYVNDAFCRISGYSREELIGRSHNIIRHPETPSDLFKQMWHTIKVEKKIWQGIIRNRSKDGRSYYVDSTIVPILDFDGSVIEFISLRNDVTMMMRPYERLKDEIAVAKKPLLLYVKLEDYALLEDFYDHDTLEKIIKKTMENLEKRCRELCRTFKSFLLGEGIFALFANDATCIEVFQARLDYVEEIIEHFRDYFVKVQDFNYHPSLLMSVVWQKEQMLASAKIGIKHLEQNKGEHLIVANGLAQEGQERAKENLRMVQVVRNAIRDGRIVSFFQPIVANHTQKVVKYESLVRLINEKGKLLSPWFFLDVAKKSDQYFKITQVVLENSFAMLRKCACDISINLSVRDLEYRLMREQIEKLLKIHAKQAHRIIFELLEDEESHNVEMVYEAIRGIKAQGAKIAIDDFGTGYSNFHRLLNYQPDILKIDGSIIRNITHDSVSQSALKSILAFAKDQGLETVAEFVEDRAIYEYVAALGVDYSQGYYFGKPEPADRLVCMEDVSE